MFVCTPAAAESRWTFRHVRAELNLERVGIYADQGVPSASMSHVLCVPPRVDETGLGVRQTEADCHLLLTPIRLSESEPVTVLPMAMMGVPPLRIDDRTLRTLTIQSQGQKPIARAA